MPKNVMKLLKHTANYSRHSFDLSHRHLVTANFGELLPVTFIETLPDDYIEFSASDLLRAIPMVTSPFLRAKQHIDVWYVPYDYLWSNFTAFIEQKSQPTSSALKAQAFVPCEDINYITGVIDGESSSYDVVGRDFKIGAKKLFDLCGYGKFKHTSEESYQNRYVNLFRIAAYNKIWYDEYRQQYYDDGIRFLSADNDPNVACTFNFDDVPCDTAAKSRIYNGTAATPSYRILEMFQMRYRCWKKDLFTGVLPSTQYGAVSSVPLSLTSPSITSTDANRWLDAVTSDAPANSGVQTGVSAYPKNLALGDQFSAHGIIHDHTIGAISGSYDILELRKSTAIQLWRERSLTAGNRISDNFKAHYGASAEYDDHRCTFLGSVDAPLQIQDINAQAQTGSGTNQGLGDVAGKGTSTLSDKIFKFKGHEFGVIVALFSLLPEAEYESEGIDRMNQLLEWEDFFHGEFQNLGLEGVPNATFYHDVDVAANSIFGYAPRYWGYKQKLDKCFNGFKDNQPFAPWASPKTDVTEAFDDTQMTAMPRALLYVDPNTFNRNFAVDVDNSDQFLCDLYFDVEAVRQMSVSGLPNT